MARVAVIFTGGTIAMRPSPDASGVVPALRPGDLLAAVPDLDRIADVEPVDWGLVPASHLTFDQVLDIGRVLDAQLRRDEIDGAVVVQGTDVLEETAYAWSLLPLPSKPVVVVGAMRNASQDGYDGPVNLRDAVTAAASPELAEAGVVVAMAGELHPADDVRKTHTHDLATFQSPNRGRLGTVDDGRIRIERRSPVVRLPAIPQHAALPIPLVTAVLDEPAPPSDAFGSAAGLVVAATGGGNTTPGMLELATTMLDRGVPVALTTRCPSGRPMPGYGFPGGSSQWWASGAIFTGTLGALKSRVLLALGIGAGLAARDLAVLCEPYDGGRIGSG